MLTIIGLVVLGIVGVVFLMIGLATAFVEGLLSSKFYFYPWVLVGVGSAIIWLAIHLAPFKIVLTST